MDRRSRHEVYGWQRFLRVRYFGWSANRQRFRSLHALPQRRLLDGDADQRSQYLRPHRVGAFHGRAHDRHLEEEPDVGATSESDHSAWIGTDRQEFWRFHEADADL